MFGFSKRKGEVVSHWYSLVEGFNTSSKEFYDAVEKELKERQLPGLELFHVEFSEGGVLSANREYLRMTRERLIFDVCAAPFGTSFFFSCRFVEIPAVIQLWQLLVLSVGFLIAIPFSLALCVKIFGLYAPFIWPVAWIAFFVLAIYTMRNAVALGLKDLDATLVKSPVLGPMYERWFRKETYYREDTRIMYRETVDAVVKAKIEEVTGAKGIKLIRFNQYRPILGELYKPTEVKLPSQSPPP